jgi:hypothetical protein
MSLGVGRCSGRRGAVGSSASTASLLINCLATEDKSDVFGISQLLAETSEYLPFSMQRISHQQAHLAYAGILLDFIRTAMGTSHGSRHTAK